jgi:hypothetical protein
LSTTGSLLRYGPHHMGIFVCLFIFELIPSNNVDHSYNTDSTIVIRCFHIFYDIVLLQIVLYCSICTTDNNIVIKYYFVWSGIVLNGYMHPNNLVSV